MAYFESTFFCATPSRGRRRRIPRTVIYLDNHATTPVDPRVLEAMLPYFGERFGNAASREHAFGRAAEAAVNDAREAVAGLINAPYSSVVFTSGATESNNLAIKGVAEAYGERGDHIIACAVEHKSVLDVTAHLETRGWRVTYLPVDASGLVDPERLRDAITDRTVLISVMAANNEIGTLQPVGAIGAIARERGVLFHTDAAQAVGKIAIDVEAMGIDLLSLSGHKVYGPKGIGALFIRRRDPAVRLAPQIHGGGHEGGARSGTLNVPGIVGLGRACAIARDEMAGEGVWLAGLRERLRSALFEGLDGIWLNGHPEARLPGNLNVSIEGVRGETLLLGLREVAVSFGSACTSAAVEPSYVLLALGRPEHLAQAAIRFGIGRFNTEEEVDAAARAVVAHVRRLRGAR